jgi:hypothetical protein
MTGSGLALPLALHLHEPIAKPVELFDRAGEHLRSRGSTWSASSGLDGGSAIMDYSA